MEARIERVKFINSVPIGSGQESSAGSPKFTVTMEGEVFTIVNAAGETTYVPQSNVAWWTLRTSREEPKKK